MAEKRKPRELFASPQDIVTAHLIVDEVLGPEFDLNYLTFPKSTGAMGDEGVLGRTVWITTKDSDRIRELLESSYETDQATRDILANPEPGKMPPPLCRLGETALRVCNETKSASRVVLDITPPLPSLPEQ